jgi:para-aminobenzoate synthetase / 4-amino-4-deoxychorismate lyase
MLSPAIEEDRATTNPVAWSALPTAMRTTALANPGSVLLETSRFDPYNRHSYLFTDPVNILIARALNEIPNVFTQIESALANGFYVAGYFAYECGYHFEPSSAADFQPTGRPLIWLGVYRQPRVFDHAIDPSSATDRSALAALDLEPIALEIPRPAYQAKIKQIREYIAAGDTYQVNFTNRITFDTQLPSAEIFANLSTQQPVAYSAFLNLGDRQILSFSPELFFRIQNGKIITRPMKGTMPRGLDTAEDAAAAIRLRNDEKNRSEHVMIVDLLRNDLGRICAMGSVQVEELFTVERYETLLQMTSAISGTLRPEISYYEIFRSLFPSGSITGAPKVRTMQIIRELEDQPRGIYTGAIGFIAPNRNSVFNVAIRTLVLENSRASLGVGGGIVADSDPADEYRECLLKASFLTRIRPEFELIETILWDGGFPLLPLHLNRLESSASYFSFIFDRPSFRSLTEVRLHDIAASFEPNFRHRVRLLFAHDGTFKLTSEPFPQTPPKGLVRLSSQRTSSTVVFFRHKTTQRALYDQQYAHARANGLDDILFLNEKGELAEGAISNVFLERAGKLLTPPLSCGVLDGVYRRHLLQTRPEAEEQILTAADLHTADAIYLCNALRGIYKVKLLDAE